MAVRILWNNVSKTPLWTKKGSTYLKDPHPLLPAVFILRSDGYLSGWSLGALSRSLALSGLFSWERHLHVLIFSKVHMSWGLVLLLGHGLLGRMPRCAWEHWSSEGVCWQWGGQACGKPQVLSASSINSIEMIMLTQQWHDRTGQDGSNDLTWVSTSTGDITDKACRLICPYKPSAMNCVHCCLFCLCCKLPFTLEVGEC